PYPFSETTNTDTSGLSTLIMPTTSSLACANVIPRTPVAVRPIGRTLDSLKRIALPERKAITISLVPLVKQASINWSPSLIFIALIPFARRLAYGSSDVFLLVPRLVHIMMQLFAKYSLSFKFFTNMYALIFSSFGILLVFCNARPLDVRLPSGSSKARNQQQRPD